jgi:hypothetical protein
MLEFKPIKLQTSFIVGLSSEADLPDSHTLYAKMYMSIYGSHYELRIAKKVISREHVVLARLLYPLCCCSSSCCSWWIVTHGIRRHN